MDVLIESVDRVCCTSIDTSDSTSLGKHVANSSYAYENFSFCNNDDFTSTTAVCRIARAMASKAVVTSTSTTKG